MNRTAEQEVVLLPLMHSQVWTVSSYWIFDTLCMIRYSFYVVVDAVDNSDMATNRASTFQAATATSSAAQMNAPFSGKFVNFWIVSLSVKIAFKLIITTLF